MKTLCRFDLIDTLHFFTDRYSLMSIEQQVNLAKLMNQNCQGYAQILVVETGAAPLMKVMQELEKREVFYLKIPREASLHDFAAIEQQYPNLRDFISKPFLILDEYIDSGHTINLMLSFLKHIHCKEHYKIICYMLFSQDPNIQKLLHFVCANHPSKPHIFADDHFAKGIYPFENRLDYAPYFYVNSRKVLLEHFKLPHFQEIDDTELHNIAEQFLANVKTAMTVACVADFITAQHVYLYCLFCLEHDPLRKQLFWLLFDSIGPFWTPLPQEYHFSYWQGFETVQPELKKHLQTIQMDLAPLAHEAACFMLDQHQIWFTSIQDTIRKQYAAK